MRTIKKSMLATILMVTALATFSFGQGPVNKRLNYTINVPYELQVGNYILPMGKYVLYQIEANDPNLFALYEEDMTHEPVAMIRTTRVEYQTGEYPEKTKFMFNIDETSAQSTPILRGWTIPGQDGWEVISVVAKDNGVLTRAH